MSRFALKHQPRFAAVVPPFARLSDELARAEIERGSEAHTGCPELQIKWDEYLDAVDLAKRSGEPEDRLTASRLYLAYAQARDEQENAP